MMEEAIKNFPQQFSFQPKYSSPANFSSLKKFIVCGMGGSHLAADLLKTIDPTTDLLIHSDYGLPNLSPTDIKSSLFIFSSYSGNTEETIDAYHQAKKLNLPSVVIAVGGVLLELAKKDQVPYIQLPATGIQPRSALGYSFLALLTIVGNHHLIEQAKQTAQILEKKMTDLKIQGFDLADEIVGFVPVIISSQTNFSLGYNWKIKFNETGKIPAFNNVVPELNHNEMTGFDLNNRSIYLADRFYFLFLVDDNDHPRIRRRMEVLFQIYHEKGLPVKNISISGSNITDKVFSCLLLADWAALKIAQHFDHEAEQVPMVEDFKKRINH